MSEPFTSRIGVCNELRGILKIIADDKKAMGQTFDGLIDPSPTNNRSYRAFEAIWTEIKQ